MSVSRSMISSVVGSCFTESPKQTSSTGDKKKLPGVQVLKTASAAHKNFVQAVQQGETEEVEKLLKTQNTLVQTRFSLHVEGYGCMYQATCLHLACLSQNEAMNVKMAQSLIKHANAIQFDIISVKTEGLSTWTAFDFVIEGLASIHLAPCFFEESFLFPLSPSVLPPIYQMISHDNLSLMHRVFKHLSSRDYYDVCSVFLSISCQIPLAVVGLIDEYIPFHRCQKVIRLANQAFFCPIIGTKTPLRESVTWEKRAITKLLLEAGARWDEPLQDISKEKKSVLKMAQDLKYQWFLDMVAKGP